MARHLLQAYSLVVVLAATALPSRAATQVTVAQLDQFLASENSAHTSDSEVAQRLTAAELTERLTRAQLAWIRAKFSPGPETMQALDLLADRSEFLNLPDAEILRRSSPSAAEQKQMIHSAERFATETLSHLPDYLARETTMSFEDIPVFTKTTSMQSGLYPTGTTVLEVAYRSGREVSSRPLAAPVGHPVRANGSRLESLGQFGPVLATLMTDSVKGTIEWDHWEQTATGILAVFTYSVPQDASHYRVDFCCISNDVEGGLNSFHGTPAYHGTLSIDPATGAILRVTLLADFPEFDPEPDVDLMVEYQNVDVSGGNLICPVRSVALSEAYTWARKRYWTNLYLNEINYTNFHRFGSTARVLESAPP